MAEHNPRHNQRHTNPSPALDLSAIRFSSVAPELFNETALSLAKTIANADRNANKATQLRRFFDEIVLWESRARQQPDKFDEYLPFIRMINAKAAYAQGRKLVDPSFVSLMQKTLAEVTNPTTMTRCKYFWEAFMGFYKQERGDR